jgi:hypothetical protein
MERKKMGFLSQSKRRLGIAGELLQFLMQNKRWWLVPMMAVLLVFAVIMVIAQSSAIAPFIYTLF